MSPERFIALEHDAVAGNPLLHLKRPTSQGLVGKPLGPDFHQVVLGDDAETGVPGTAIIEKEVGGGDFGLDEHRRGSRTSIASILRFIRPPEVAPMKSYMPMVASKENLTSSA